MMKIAVIGSGYVGLVTGVCFAEMGNQVTLVDIDPQKIDSLSKGIPTIYELSLHEMLEKNLKDSRLHFTTNYQDALKDASICFLAVNTPIAEDGSADTSFLFQAASMIAEAMDHEITIVNKSTAPLGTLFQIEARIKETLQTLGKDIPFQIAANPEFLKEGEAIADFMRPDRVIVGANDPSTIKLLHNLYAPFMMSADRFLVMDILSAELVKYASNAMLATRISFMNEMASLCESLGANIHMVRHGIGTDQRIGSRFLYAGPGFGGSCLPKDLRALIHSAKSEGLPASLLTAVYEVNQKQRESLVTKVEQYFARFGGMKGKRIGILGLSFKPNTDDIRDAPSIPFMKALLKKGAHLLVYDPMALSNIKKVFANEPLLSFCQSELEVSNEADALCLLTEWRQFRHLNLGALIKKMKGSAFFDFRALYDPTLMKQYGFDYVSIGIKQQILEPLDV